jgi:hypothetical protein
MRLRIAFDRAARAKSGAGTRAHSESLALPDETPSSPFVIPSSLAIRGSSFCCGTGCLIGEIRGQQISK